MSLTTVEPRKLLSSTKRSLSHGTGVTAGGWANQGSQVLGNKALERGRASGARAHSVQAPCAAMGRAHNENKPLLPKNDRPTN